ncbi:MAG TPA: alpha/beta-hydrolase N-terminal domain-containing protein, partial [Jiangellaceae bacterium]
MAIRSEGRLPPDLTELPPPRDEAREPEAVSPSPRPRWWRRWFTYTLPGSWVALLFACLSFTPSLLPRPPLFQGAVTGVSAAIGYGLGVFGAWVWREFADRDRRSPRRGGWRIFAVVAAPALLGSAALGYSWQGQLRDLMGMPSQGPSFVLLPITAAVLFVVILAVGRALRAVYRRLARWLERWFGTRAARATGLIVVAGGTWLVVSGVLLDGLISAADRAFAVRNLEMTDGVEQPTSDLRSGSPASLVAWETIGRWGRTFVASGPSADDIAAFTGDDATEPIRVFVGTESAQVTEERAELAVRDLDRAGGFDRSYLLVASTTGSGLLVSSAVDSFEYITAGDSAIVAIQYSHLPSSLSYLVDQERAREAGRQLFDAVYERWSELPADDRPQLLVYGESLGSFGAEAAFSGEHDMANRTDGALFVGPPSFNTHYGEFTDDRRAGSR